MRIQEIRKLLRAEHLRLVKLPEAAKRVEMYQPQPDPMQQQLMQMEMLEKQKKIEKMDAEIAAIYAGAKEDDADQV